MELRDELLDSLILDNTYIKLEDLDKKYKLEKIIPIVKDMKIVGECRYHVVDVYKHSLYSLKELEEDDAVTLTGYVLNHDPEFRAGDTMKVANFQFTALDYDNAYISEFIVQVSPTPRQDRNNNGIFDEDEMTNKNNEQPSEKAATN